MIVITQFSDSFLVIVVLFIFFIDIVDGYTDNVDHVPKERSTTNLYDHDYQDFIDILRRDIAVTNGNDGCDGPIYGINVSSYP